MSLVSERRPLPVSTIEIVVGVMWYVKSACVVGFCTGLKSRLIAWGGDIWKCTQMNTACDSETQPAQPQNPNVRTTGREGQPKLSLVGLQKPVSGPVPLLLQLIDQGADFRFEGSTVTAAQCGGAVVLCRNRLAL